jgi:predicted deacylase
MTANVELDRRVIEGSNSGPHLLITGGVHGDEFEPMAAIRRLMKAVSPKELSGRLTLVPVVNEPAFLRGSRTAEDGLDLARTCPGRSDGSTTERIAHALTQLIHTADYFIDLHTGGTALSLVPLVGYMLHSNAEVLEKQRRMARAFNLPIVWGTTAKLEGRSTSAARDANVPAIYAEYFGGGQCSAAGIEDYVSGCLNVMRELKMIGGDAPISRIAHVVEDNRANSGYLQIKHPAPATGYFETAVNLGQTVRKGELLGRLLADSLGEHAYEIHADHSGIVICLSTFPRVMQGSSVAVVLELDVAAKQ